MKRSLLGLVLALSVVTSITTESFAGSFQTFGKKGAAQNGAFPTGPDANLTPGKVCDAPNTWRYPEHVAYCSRDVSSETKWAVIKKYDQVLGFKIQTMDRGDFKIDHYIPLCAGGSNDESNLWPQHKSVYAITDPLEPEVCAKMASGRLKQADAVALIKDAKNHLEKVQEILNRVRSM